MSAVMQFTLTGFTQDLAFRVFAFERLGSDRVRTKMTVKADLGLTRRYGIQMQELPLLCRNLLERSENGTETHTFTFSENDMCLHAKDRASAKEAAAQRRKSPRRTPSENVGAAWRGHQPIQAARATDGSQHIIHGQKIIETA
ncbi:MAG TPA: hypothetical protein VGQ49_14150 [Bryobacteraceae bacterium]|jgi:hypothetical protein|nr:hypothetical protein [Bryobacteraceae bacterium]